MRRKEVDDVLGGDEMWIYADSTDGEWYWNLKVCLRPTSLPSLASCDKCNNRRAFFYQLQIRSADEPMTTCAFICSEIDQAFTLLRVLSLSVG